MLRTALKYTGSLLAAVALMTAGVARADKIDTTGINFPWMNSPAHDARYRLADHPNGVFVFEVYSVSCSWCNKNAEQVDAFATAYKNDVRVQVIDLGLDTNDRDYRNWISMHHPNHPVVKDVEQRVWRALQKEDGIPQTFVVACDGTVVTSTLGYWGDEEKQTLREGVAKAEAITCP